jgi:hypothetical protein
LLLKNLHKFYNREDIPWVNLIWSKYYANGDVKITDYSVSNDLQHEYIQDLFHLPMSQATYEEFIQLE